MGNKVKNSRRDKRVMANTFEYFTGLTFVL